MLSISITNLIMTSMRGLSGVSLCGPNIQESSYSSRATRFLPLTSGWRCLIDLQLAIEYVADEHVPWRVGDRERQPRLLQRRLRRHTTRPEDWNLAATDANGFTPRRIWQLIHRDPERLGIAPVHWPAVRAWVTGRQRIDLCDLMRQVRSHRHDQIAAERPDLQRKETIRDQTADDWGCEARGPLTGQRYDAN